MAALAQTEVTKIATKKDDSIRDYHIISSVRLEQVPPWLLKLGFQPGRDDGGDFVEEVSFDFLVGGQLSVEHDPDWVVDLSHQQALDHRGAQ